MVTDDVITLGSHGVTAAEVVAVARHDRRVELGADARAALERGAAVVARLVDQPEPGVRRVDRVRRAGQHGDPGRTLGRAADGADPLARRRAWARRSSARSCGRWCSCAPAAWRWATRAPARWSPRRCSPCSNAGVTPVVREHGSLGASGDLAPLASAALVLLGEGAARLADGTLVDGATALRRRRPRAARAAGQGGPRPHQRHRRDARHARAGARRPRRAAAGRPTSPAPMSTEALLGTDRAFAADLVAHAPPARAGDERGEPARGCSPARRSSPATATATTASRTPTRCAARRRSTARPATPSITPAASPSASSSRSSTTRSCCPTDGSSRAATSTAHRSPRSADFLAISIADVGAISERRTDRLLDRSPLAAACRRSSPPTPASTRA